MTWNDYDDETTAKEVEDIEKNGGQTQYKSVPPGNYEVTVIKMEPCKSKSGKDMLTIRFKILEGEHKNSLIFCHQTLTSAFSIHKANELLRGLTQDIPGFYVRYANRKQYENLVMDVFEAIAGKYDYVLEYGETSKGFPTFEIKEVFLPAE